MNGTKTPPLPPSPAEVSDLILQTREHVQSLGWGNRERLYTESQVRAIMAECVLKHRSRREWQSLTEEEIYDMSLGGTDSELRKQQFARAIEAALKERNHE